MMTTASKYVSAGPLSDVVAAIGRTPLIKLRRVSEETGCTILGKAEFANPGGSIKDRTAKFIIEDAEKKRTAQSWWCDCGRHRR